jgi:hypothetical protein
MDAPMTTAPHQIPTKRAPTTIARSPRNLSILCSGTPSPWGSLRCRHYSHHLHPPQPFARQKHNPSIYPAYIHTPSAPKSHTSNPTHIFETVSHPLGIGPAKPVTRTPVSSTCDTLAPRSQPKAAQPLTVQCGCGQLVRVSPVSLVSQPLQLPTIQSQLSRAFPTHISNFQFLLKSFSLPSLFFSRFSFSMAMKASP